MEVLIVIVIFIIYLAVMIIRNEDVFIEAIEQATKSLNNESTSINKDNTDKPKEALDSQLDYLNRLDTRFISAEEKTAYLASKKWKELRKKILMLHSLCEGHNCYNLATEVHHVSYIDLTDESPDQLAALCRSCHQKIHDRLGYDRATYYPIKILKEIK